MEASPQCTIVLHCKPQETKERPVLLVHVESTHVPTPLRDLMIADYMGRSRNRYSKSYYRISRNEIARNFVADTLGALHHWCMLSTHGMFQGRPRQRHYIHRV